MTFACSVVTVIRFVKGSSSSVFGLSLISRASVTAIHWMDLLGPRASIVNAFRGMVSIQVNNVLIEWDGILDYENVRCGTRSL